MGTHNTNNPIGSSDPRDLYDNAQALDHAVNSQSDAFQDRFGIDRKTFAGIEREGISLSESAAASAAAADASAITAAGAANTALTKAGEASDSAASAESSASMANSRAIAADASATTAVGAANTALTKAGEASDSAVSAESSASMANSRAIAADASATTAAGHANDAAASAAAAAASFDAFDDKYLGAKSTSPTTDNDGGTLQVGAIYWHTGANAGWRVWTGSVWINPTTSTPPNGSITAEKLADGAVVPQKTAPAVTTAGASPAYTLALSPAPTLAAGLRVRVNFHAATTAAATLNVSGTGAKPLKQYSPSGTKVDAVIALGQRADVEYDGTDWVILDALPPAAPAQATQAEMEAGTETGVRSMSPENIAQAIEALASGGAAFERITASKTVTVPPGMTGARLFGCAGGGGGGYSTTAGSAGGSTSFGAYSTATGGGGGGGGTSGAGGAGGAGDFVGGSGGGGKAHGSPGVWGAGGKSSGSFTPAGGGGGGSLCQGGDGAIGTSGTATAGMKGSGGGGGRPVSDGSGGSYSPGGGGGGGVIDTHVTGLTPGQQIVVTIGAGGAGAHSTAGGGGGGYLDVLWTA